MNKKLISVVFLATVFCAMVYSQVPSGVNADVYRINRYTKFGEDFTGEVEGVMILKGNNTNSQFLIIMRKGASEVNNLEEGMYDWIVVEDYNSSDRQYKAVKFNGNELKAETLAVGATVTITGGKLQVKLAVIEMPELVLVELEGTYLGSEQF